MPKLIDFTQARLEHMDELTKASVELVPVVVLSEFLKTQHAVRTSFYTSVSYPLINNIIYNEYWNIQSKTHRRLSAFYWLVTEGKIRTYDFKPWRKAYANMEAVA